MSVDRGFLGRAPGDRDSAMFKSMDDLSTQKATGLELVRLLRVIIICRRNHFLDSKFRKTAFKILRNLRVLLFDHTNSVFFLQDAEQSGYTAEDVQVSLNHCGDSNPVTWLNENWDNMMETVMTLASNVGHEAEENTIGTLSKAEAKDALRKHKGNIWAAVTECVEQRQAKVGSIPSSENPLPTFLLLIWVPNTY